MLSTPQSLFLRFSFSSVLEEKHKAHKGFGDIDKAKNPSYSLWLSHDTLLTSLCNWVKGSFRLCQWQWSIWLTDNTHSKWHFSCVTVLVYHVPVTASQMCNVGHFHWFPFSLLGLYMFSQGLFLELSARPDENGRTTILTLNKLVSCVSLQPQWSWVIVCSLGDCHVYAQNSPLIMPWFIYIKFYTMAKMFFHFLVQLKKEFRK